MPSKYAHYEVPKSQIYRQFMLNTGLKPSAIAEAFDVTVRTVCHNLQQPVLFGNTPYGGSYETAYARVMASRVLQDWKHRQRLANAPTPECYDGYPS